MPETGSMNQAEISKWQEQESIKLFLRYPGLLLMSTIKGLAKMMLVPGEKDLLEHVGLRYAETGGVIGDLLRLSSGDYIRKWLDEYWSQFFISILSAMYLFVVYLAACL